MAIVFAQTEIKGKNEGIHAFIVPTRDKPCGQPLPGVFIQDMGEKFGLNGIDNGRLAFNNVRIPKDNLLNKYSDVDEQNNFNSAIKGKRSRFLKVADRLLSGRLCITSMSVAGSRLTLLITLKYGQTRKAVDEQGLSTIPIAKFALFQNQVMPIMSRVIAISIAANHIKQIYSDYLLGKVKYDSLYIITLCCSIKPIAGWTMRDLGTTCIERVGGQGYLTVNEICNAVSFGHSSIVAEGDNSVLMQKTTKEIMTMAQKGTFEYPQFTELQIEDINGLVSILSKRELLLIEYVQNLTTEGISQGKNENLKIQQLAMAYIERKVAEFNRDFIQQQEVNQIFLLKWFKLYLISCIKKDLDIFIELDIIKSEQVKYLNKEHQILIKQVSEFALDTALSFGIPDHLVQAPIANSLSEFNPLHQKNKWIQKL